MSNKKNVSVIVLTYNPNYSKLLSTVRSIVCQKNVDIELIISDDGSLNDYINEIEDFFNDIGFKDYIINKNLKNVGTVKNYLSALKIASGEYVYGISPGDLLYDDHCLNDIYEFLVENDAEICFGKAVNYYFDDGKIVVSGASLKPRRPQIFSPKFYSHKRAKVAFFFGNFILGAAFMRKRDTAIQYIKRIEETAKYAEDNTSTAYAVLDHKKVLYFDRNILWYEIGTGISTHKGKSWDSRIKADYDRTFNLLKQVFPKDPVLDAAYIEWNSFMDFKKRIINFTKHPIVHLWAKFLKLYPLMKLEISEKDKQYLIDLLSIE
ncbi:glycosyltransferase [Clostridium thermarum]|uniref:glycosyltransferase n=1 Tax=Clostridium thermarum TaxID=1716543 RepID=UPI0013D85138|nr:glycosyltransferase [Clostridium thermarum]